MITRAKCELVRRPEGEVTLEARQSLPITIDIYCKTPHANGEDPAPSAIARLAAAMRLPELDAKRGANEALAYAPVSPWRTCSTASATKRRPACRKPTPCCTSSAGS